MDNKFFYHWKFFALLLIVGVFPLYAHSPIKVVAAENFYGDVVKQIGGDYVSVTSIMGNPAEDPHLFSSSVSTSKAIAAADLIVYNGIDYDPWMKNLVQTAHQPHPIIIVADLLGKKEGDNPHIWYDPATMLIFSKKMTAELARLDPANREYFQERLKVFAADYESLTRIIEKMKNLYAGTPVIATEPIFNDMAESLGLKMYGQGLQLSVMNDTEPSASDIAEFESKLKNRSVKLMIYNTQVASPITEKLKKMASDAQIPIVGVSETEPAHQNYVTWMSEELKRIEAALSGGGIVDRH